MTQEFLNEAKLPFKDCSREEQHILLNAIMDCNAETFMHGDYREMHIKTHILIDSIYRTKPIKRLAIPWEHILKDFKFAMMTCDGAVYVYTGNPKTCAGYSAAEISCFLNIDTTGISWRDSLVERPAEVKS